MVCPPRAAVLGSRTRVDAYNRSITKPLTGEPDAGDPPVRFGGRGKVQSLVPTPINSSPESTHRHLALAEFCAAAMRTLVPARSESDGLATTRSDRKSTR